MFDFYCEISKDKIDIKTTLRRGRWSKGEVYSFGLTEKDVNSAVNEKDGDLDVLVEGFSSNNFLVVFVDSQNRTLYLFNDHFGHHQIFWKKEDSRFILSSTVNNITDLEIDKDSVIEFLSTYAVLAPRTIFKNLSVIPMAHKLKIDISAWQESLHRYWRIENLFHPKYQNYDEEVIVLRNTFYKEIKTEANNKKIGATLSGGIDSGGIVGMLCDSEESAVPTYSFGPYGKNSGDLVSSRITSKYFNSKNKEIYPSEQLIENLFHVSGKLDQPIIADQLLAGSELYRSASEDGIEKLYFGYGTQMLLGNLKLNQIWQRERIILKFLPRFVLNLFYRIYASYKGLSSNGLAILLESDWRKRFFYLQVPLFTREAKIYKNKKINLYENINSTLDFVYNLKKLKLSDRFTLFYLFTWTNYGQERNNQAFGNIYNIQAFSPYNTVRVATVLAKTPDKFRKKNNWNKQLWRDSLKPYVPEHLYMRKGKSLTIPYPYIFGDALEIFLPYIKNHPILNEVIDFTVYQSEFRNLPEPGLNLLRLIGFAVWYDSHFRTESLPEIKALFKEFDFSSRMRSYEQNIIKG